MFCSILVMFGLRTLMLCSILFRIGLWTHKKLVRRIVMYADIAAQSHALSVSAAHCE